MKKFVITAILYGTGYLVLNLALDYFSGGFNRPISYVFQFLFFGIAMGIFDHYFFNKRIKKQ